MQNSGAVNITPSPIFDYASAPHLFVSRYDSASQTVEIWIDGVMVGSGSGYTVPIGSSDNIRLMRHFGSSLRLDGKLGEVVAIASSAASDREMLEGHAAHRWGLTGALPAGHPYKTDAH